MNFLDLLEENTQSNNYYPSNNCCLENTNVYFLCSNYECKKSPIMCKNLKCSCHQIHKKCLKTEKKSLITALEDKLVSYKNVEETIKTEISKLREKLEEIETSLLKCINTKELEQIGLNKVDKELLSYLKSGQYNQLSGYRIYEAMSNLIRPQKVNKVTENMEEDIKNFCSILDETVSKFRECSKLKIESFNEIHFAGSSIIKNQQEEQILEKFFESQSKRIKKIDLFFKASQNEFSAKKFHEKCDKIPQTITLCKTENGNIFGGYSKVEWKDDRRSNSNEKGFSIQDSSGESFLFSINNNQKFNLENYYQSILYREGYGPSFGSDIGHSYYDQRKCDLYISDKCNENTYSNFCPKNSFKINNSNQNQSNYIFNNITISEYEVWQVTFEN